MRVFPEEISICISGPSKVDCPPQCGRPLGNPLRSGIEQKIKEGSIPSLYLTMERGHKSPALGIPGSQAFRGRLEYTPLTPDLSLLIAPPASPGLPPADGGTSQSP